MSLGPMYEIREIVCAVGYVLLLAVSATDAGMITLHTGNGAVPGRDSEIHVLFGATSGPFGAALTVSDFAAACIRASIPCTSMT